MDSYDSETRSDSEKTSSSSSSCVSSYRTIYGMCRSVPEKIIDKSIKARFYASYRRQCFSLPDSVMHYIAMKPPSIEVYQKLVQSCKYFFVKNPILVISDLYYDSKTWAPVNYEKYINLDFVSSKFWVTQSVYFYPVTQNTQDKGVASFISKIYQCDATLLYIINRNISYDELIIFGTNFDSLHLRKGNVTYKDGSNVECDRIIQILPKIIYLEYIPPSVASAITSKTFKELLRIPQFLKLKGCAFYKIPEDFDLDVFYKYMKKNKHTSIILHFCYIISEAYRNRLQAIVTEITESETHEYKPPYIFFNGLDEKKRSKLWNLYDRHL
uniref:Uncharacterized protein n=1 Tax=Panagrolaimus sp. ES5 TaxID=591445 RepID=A0AC34FRT2_9BILA